MKIRACMLLVLSFIFLWGCSSEDQIADYSQKLNESPSVENMDHQKENQPILYNNHELGLTILETENWQVINEVKQPFNVLFENDKMKALITIISNESSFSSIKEELVESAGNVTIIEEKDSFITYISNRKESIRTLVYLYSFQEQTGIVTFITPEEDYVSNIEEIELFHSNIYFFTE